MVTPKSKAAILASEICERIAEAEADDAMGHTKAALFIVRLGNIFNKEPRAFWIVVRLFSGDLAELTRSYSEMARTKDRKSKQAVQQEWEKALSSIVRHFPELTEAIEQLRHIRAEWRYNVKVTKEL